ncbi:hypothetical protein [Actinomadura sp. 9N407]|uniref:hypothetical protein n=1 Tax=Actinomadura sp. 9N407 TaxID=3375154 RepID=UPI00379D609D
MNLIDQRVRPRPDGQRPAALTVAHVLLWVQATLFSAAWLIPNGFVALIVLAEGVPDDEGAGWLLVPVIYSAPLLLLAVPGIALAARFSRGRGVVRGGIVLFEVVLGSACLLVILAGAGTGIGVIFVPVLLLAGTALMGAYVTVVLLGPDGRAYFHRERSAP